jgi:hypothetical protein
VLRSALLRRHCPASQASCSPASPRKTSSRVA